jgi:hypothetical protein
MTEAAVATPEAPKPSKRHISKVRKKAALTRWDSVREERLAWMRPFQQLPIERALAYLEDLRSICEEAGHYLNERINSPHSPMRCAGPRCGKDMSGTTPNGRPKWVGQKVIKDKKNPEIKHTLYFCSAACDNGWVRAQQGGGGTTGQ